MNKVLFHTADKKLTLKGKKEVKEFIAELFFKEYKLMKRLDYIFCSDEYLLKINNDFLSHDYYTDIITFDLSSTQEIEGEIYISLDRVKDNAAKHLVAYRTELLRVVFHGALHLCGYRDKKKSEITTMRAKEDYYLRLFDKKIDEIK